VGVGCQRHAPAALTPGNILYPLYTRLGGSQVRSGRVRKISSTTGIRSPDRPVLSKSLFLKWKYFIRIPFLCDMAWPLCIIGARLFVAMCCHLQGSIFPFLRILGPTDYWRWGHNGASTWNRLSTEVASFTNKNYLLDYTAAKTLKLENCFMLFVKKWNCFEQSLFHVYIIALLKMFSGKYLVGI